MNTIYRKFALIGLTVALSAAAILFWNFTPQANGQTRPLFFTLKDIPQARVDKTSIASVKESEISVNFQSLTEANSARLVFPLFDGKTYEAKREDWEARGAKDFTWRGKISEGEFKGDVILTFRNGFVSGLIYAPNTVYEIIPKADRQILVELNQSEFPECAGDIKGAEAKKISSERDAPAALIDSGDRIDVLVVYTTATKNFLGGDAQAQTLAQQAIDATNTAYINSKIRQRVRMVQAQEYLYTESGDAGVDLSNLRNNAQIATLRQTYRADLVAMIEEVSSVCGIGYLMGGVGGNPINGFTVTSRSCAVGNLSFAHELGHNMGSQHNPENGSNPTYPFGFGHYVNGSYRTVMSYVNPCPNGCARVAHFSNPNVIFNNQPTGIPDQRDNARSINLTADTIANYRYSGSNLMLSSFNGGEAISLKSRQTITWSSDSLGGNVKIEVSLDESTNYRTLVDFTPNDGAETITISGRASRLSRFRITSIENPSVSDSSLNNFSILR